MAQYTADMVETRVGASKPLTVSEFIRALKGHVEAHSAWQHLLIVGELSGVKHHPSGHWYFTLKEGQSQLRGVMFRREAVSLTYPLKDGMEVLVRGRVGVYDRDGQVQIYAHKVDDIGAGAAQRALEELTRRLADEGLFRRPKRKLPVLPRGVAVITSASGAAIGDIRTVAARRFPGMPIHLIPATVQGQGAVSELLEAFERLSVLPADIVIVGRGGGGKEDLQAFNDERVVRAAYACPIPVISAVGHEIDTTLLDRVADARAATPSQAAELAVPERAVYQATVEHLGHRASQAVHRRLAESRKHLEGWTSHGVLANPHRLLEPLRRRLEAVEEHLDRWSTQWLNEPQRRLERVWNRIAASGGRHVAQAQTAFARLEGRLAAVDPEAILGQGYAYITDAQGNVVTAATAPDTITIHWHDGSRTAVLVPTHKEVD